MTGTDSRERLLDAALRVVRERGLGASRIDDVCACAGLTKGSFFHHFKGKDDLMLAAAKHWNEHTRRYFDGASYRAEASARSRLLAYVDFRLAGVDGELWEVSCFAGTIVQDAYLRQPELATLCAGNILDHVTELEREIESALAEANASVDWTPRSLALHIQGSIQGALILAKAAADVGAAKAALLHLKHHLEHLLPTAGAATPAGEPATAAPKPTPRSRRHR